MVYLPVFFFIEIFLQWEKKHPEPLQNTPRTVQNRPEHTQNRPEPPQNRPEHTQNTPRMGISHSTMGKKTLVFTVNSSSVIICKTLQISFGTLQRFSSQCVGRSAQAPKS